LRLLIRADASAEIGLGHAVRCLALAQALREEGHEVVFAFRALPERLQQELRREGVRLVPLDDGSAARLAHTVRQVDPDWVVLDGYELGPEHHEAAASSEAKVAVIDDNAELDRYACELLLNPNPFAAPPLYGGKTGARLLLGLRYALLRRETRSACREEWRARLGKRRR
jgi:UDP-2,4-diacetamido-2,4,6-trideoxy-beta-L-altropyranose hydrolase